VALCREQLFENITPAIYASLIEKVKAKTGVIITGLEGQASSQGYTVTYQFSPSTGVLSLQCLAAPWPASWASGKIESAIAQMVRDAQP
jgi:hypothetical protein